MTTSTDEARCAVLDGDIVKLRSLLSEHATLLEEEGASLLAKAARANRVDAIELLVNHGVDVNSLASRAGTALCAAAEKGAVGAAEWLMW